MVEIINRQNSYWLDLNYFKSLLKKLIAYYKLKNSELSLVFVNTKEIIRLNLKYLNKKKPTDVLSFPINEKSPDGKYYLGDIVISVPQAFKQCFHKSHGLEKEVQKLTIHGFLHLLGYNHSSRMDEEEERLKNLLSKEDHGS